MLDEQPPNVRSPRGRTSKTWDIEGFKLLPFHREKSEVDANRSDVACDDDNSPDPTIGVEIPYSQHNNSWIEVTTEHLVTS